MIIELLSIETRYLKLVIFSSNVSSSDKYIIKINFKDLDILYE